MTEIRALSVLPEARFACQGSGQCCKGYLVGPVADDVAARVDAHRFTLNAARIGASGFEVRDLHGAPTRFLRRVAGQCVFLLDDARCAIHAELGAEAKPALCRRYPLNVAVDAEGVAWLSLNMECGGYAQGRHGPPLAESVEDELDAILSVPPLFVAADCLVSPDRRWPSARVFAELEAPWLEDLDAPEPLVVVAGRLCARLWQTDTPATAWPEPGLRQFAREVAEDADAVAAEEAAAGDPVDAGLHRALAEGARALGAFADPEDLLRDQLRHAIFGKALHRAPSLAAGLGHALCQVWLAGSMAQGVDAVVAAQRVVNRCLRQSALLDPAFAVALTRVMAGLPVD